VRASSLTVSVKSISTRLSLDELPVENLLCSWVLLLMVDEDNFIFTGLFFNKKDMTGVFDRLPRDEDEL
jgi:hypothetical protein